MMTPHHIVQRHSTSTHDPSRKTGSPVEVPVSLGGQACTQGSSSGSTHVDARATSRAVEAVWAMGATEGSATTDDLLQEEDRDDRKEGEHPIREQGLVVDAEMESSVIIVRVHVEGGHCEIVTTVIQLWKDVSEGNLRNGN
ncbi:hypothetical protein PG997_002844 [Apiospora hydei]|uniref:Uncharacterized protein n=1 Tax=Apiospora hydei TaxID=1337664 RepID=A0ABR1WXL6_9PEZI